jgi:glycosyltransferase involved in cell wall biosynthesis
VIVNWNTLPYLVVALHALERYRATTTEVLVIDNFSSDGSREFLRRQKFTRSVQLPTNVKHGAALDIGFLLAKTEYVISLDPDAFPLAPGWERVLLDPLSDGYTVSGVTADRNYVHPCGLGMRRSHFVIAKHSFRSPGAWNLDDLGMRVFDCGEEISVREFPNVHMIPMSRSYGPHIAGTTWDGVLYHNFYAVRHDNTFGTAVEVLDGVVTRDDALRAWSRGTLEHLGLDQQDRERLVHR